MNKKAVILKYVTICAEQHEKNPSHEMMSLWVRVLEKQDIEKIERAFNHYIEYGAPFMPKPSDIVRLIEGTSTDKAAKAWAIVLQAVKSAGRRSTVVFAYDDGPKIHASIERMGGWQQLCTMMTKDEPFRAREFQQVYESYRVQGPENYAGKLIGEVEAHNSQFDGVKPPDPVIIGDDHAAAQRMLAHDGNARPTIGGLELPVRLLP